MLLPAAYRKISLMLCSWNDLLWEIFLSPAVSLLQSSCLEQLACRSCWDTGLLCFNALIHKPVKIHILYKPCVKAYATLWSVKCYTLRNFDKVFLSKILWNVTLSYLCMTSNIYIWSGSKPWLCISGTNKNLTWNLKYLRNVIFKDCAKFFVPVL